MCTKFTKGAVQVPLHDLVAIFGVQKILGKKICGIKIILVQNTLKWSNLEILGLIYGVETLHF